MPASRRWGHPSAYWLSGVANNQQTSTSKMTIRLRVAINLPSGAGQLVVSFGAPRLEGVMGVREFGNRSVVRCNSSETTGQTRCSNLLDWLEISSHLHPNLDVWDIVLVEHDVVTPVVESVGCARQKIPNRVEHRRP